MFDKNIEQGNEFDGFKCFYDLIIRFCVFLFCIKLSIFLFICLFIENECYLFDVESKYNKSNSRLTINILFWFEY